MLALVRNRIMYLCAETGWIVNGRWRLPCPLNIKEIKMIEFTCIICGFKYNAIRGEPEERMCHSCFEYDDILNDKEEREIENV